MKKNNFLQRIGLRWFFLYIAVFANFFFLNVLHAIFEEGWDSENLNIAGIAFDIFKWLGVGCYSIAVCSWVLAIIYKVKNNLFIMWNLILGVGSMIICCSSITEFLRWLLGLTLLGVVIAIVPAVYKH